MEQEQKLLELLDAESGNYDAMLVISGQEHTDLIHSGDSQRAEKLQVALEAGGIAIGTIISEVGGEGIIIKSNLFEGASDAAALVMHTLMEAVSRRLKGRISSRQAWEKKHIAVQKRSKRRTQ